MNGLDIFKVVQMCSSVDQCLQVAMKAGMDCGKRRWFIEVEKEWWRGASENSGSMQGVFDSKCGDDRDGVAPKCYCGVYDILYQSKTRNNPNRLFFEWPFFKQASIPHRNFFMWLDKHCAKLGVLMERAVLDYECKLERVRQQRVSQELATRLKYRVRDSGRSPNELTHRPTLVVKKMGVATREGAQGKLRRTRKARKVDKKPKKVQSSVDRATAPSISRARALLT
ncbi:hypothetical protein PIB30_043052 [Stylosanthes scabra]|uniref:Uncharacterized protein n=1 Tax=Stylosanthes scabra TaxID=79078 RepID=A0ABU6ZE83_9FABA|nr:hypothetical protein [Stylosanthes scabra]